MASQAGIRIWYMAYEEGSRKFVWTDIVLGREQAIDWVIKWWWRNQRVKEVYQGNSNITMGWDRWEARKASREKVAGRTDKSQGKGQQWTPHLFTTGSLFLGLGPKSSRTKLDLFRCFGHINISNQAYYYVSFVYGILQTLFWRINNLCRKRKCT